MAPDLVICEGKPFGWCFVLKQGRVVRARVIFSRFLIAVTGQMGLAPRDGIFRIFTDFLSWIVSLHLTIT